MSDFKKELFPGEASEGGEEGWPRKKVGLINNQAEIVDNKRLKMKFLNFLES